MTTRTLAAWLLLLAAPAAQAQSGMDMPVSPGGAEASPYPPCTDTMKDTCRQWPSATAAASAPSPVVEQHARAGQDDLSAYYGMGGPIEGEEEYRPCDRGPGDDHCIQLYDL